MAIRLAEFKTRAEEPTARSTTMVINKLSAIEKPPCPRTAPFL
jgi:hypothetical protein